MGEVGVGEQALGERPFEDGEDRRHELLGTGEDDSERVEGGDDRREGDTEALAPDLDDVAPRPVRLRPP